MKRRTNAASDGPMQMSRSLLSRPLRRERAGDRRELPIEWLAADPVFRRRATSRA
jgi:hypothetical protein